MNLFIRDYVDFKYPFRGDDAFFRLIIGGALSIILLTVIPAIFFFGYFNRLFKFIIYEEERPPTFSGISDIIFSGILTVIVLGIYFAIISILIIPFELLVNSTVIVLFIFVVYFFAGLYLLPILYYSFIRLVNNKPLSSDEVSEMITSSIYRMGFLTFLIILFSWVVFGLVLSGIAIGLMLLLGSMSYPIIIFMIFIGTSLNFLFFNYMVMALANSVLRASPDRFN